MDLLFAFVALTIFTLMLTIGVTQPLSPQFTCRGRSRAGRSLRSAVGF